MIATYNNVGRTQTEEQDSQNNGQHSEDIFKIDTFHNLIFLSAGQTARPGK